jgi:hypothetical protein
MTERFSFRDGFSARAVQADVAYAEMERLRTDGPLTASRLFEASAPKTAALHDEFEWNGKAAIRELGILRARNLMRAVVMVQEETPTEPPRHVYIHAPNASGNRGAEGEYIPLTVIVTEPDAYARAFSELTRKFDAAETALRELKQAASGLADDKAAAISVALEAFSTARKALTILAA